MLQVRAFSVILLSVFILLLLGVYSTVQFRKDSWTGVEPELTLQQLDQLRTDLRFKAGACLDNPIERAFVLKTTLKTLKLLNEKKPSLVEVSGQPRDSALSANTAVVYVYEAVLNKYTLFAIPVGEIRVRGDKITC